MTFKIVLTASLAVVALTGLAAAQDYSLSPSYGTARLNSGFLPDPHEVEMYAGGTIDASTIDANCAGKITDAPDYRLHWGGGRLSIGVSASVDTTLVINGPDGNWYCDDDTYTYDPLVGPISQAGQYDIWVGTFISGLEPATLYITEEAQ